VCVGGGSELWFMCAGRADVTNLFRIRGEVVGGVVVYGIV
jgi:hypothetical protein